jgi:hypothetical protein
MQAFERQGGELLLRKFCLLGCRRYWGNLVSEAGGFPLELLDLQLPVLMRNSVAEHFPNNSPVRESDIYHYWIDWLDQYVK